MWQPPGGPQGPPELIPVQELTSRQALLTSQRRRSSIQLEPADILNTETSEISDINAAAARRTVISRKRGSGLSDRNHHVPGLRRVSTSAQNDQPQHGSSWICQNRRCSDEPLRRRCRMANLYDIQYSPRTLLNPIPNEVIPNVTEAKDVPRRFSSKRQLQESSNNVSSNEQTNENISLWPLKHSRFSNYNDDYNVISSYPRPQLLPTEMSQCSSSESITDSEIPSLFGTRISNMPSISEYSAIISNSNLSSSNPSSSVASYTIPETLDEPISSSILENSEVSSVSSEISSSEIIAENIYGPERVFGRKLPSGKQNEIVLLDLHKLHASPNLNLPTSTVQARKVANRMILHTRMYKTLDERAVWCFNCDSIPTLPVTGQCGHTRCSKCVKENDTCPCGTPSPTAPSVNTVIQEVIHKMLQHGSGNRVVNSMSLSTTDFHQRKPSTCSPSVTVTPRRVGPWCRLRRSSNGFSLAKKSASMATSPEGRLPLTPQARFKRARELLASGRYREAATQLARVAVSSAPLARLARGLLAQTISALCQSVDPRRLTRELFRAIRLQSAASWLKPADLECVLCYHTYTNPVTTPCGHTYCRTCIERSLDYRKTCALCLRPLDDFNLAATRETEFVSAALAAIDAISLPAPPDPDVIPIFVCTVAFPSIPCPLFIFDPRYWMMIRRILESGSRKFGMVAYERDRSYSDYGTVLEVCDCVHLEDGRSILSTVGVSRFRVIERDVHDGCDVARIQPLIDIMPTEEVTWELRVMATQISYKALVWLDSMNRAVRAEIEAAFGPMPHFDGEDDWWERADGPQWLWWLIAILPLRSEIKILILSTRSLLKRMMAVTRTLEVMDSEAFINTSNNECDLGTALSSTEEWLERSA